MALDLTADPEKLAILKLFLSTQEMARPFAAPSDIPTERRSALISAFDQTVHDPELLAEANKLNMEMNPLPGETMDRLIAELYATPKPLVEKAALAVAK